MITLEKVNKFILSNLSLHIPQGECVAIIGTSGTGKTTLLKLICGMLQPESGYVRTFGQEPVRNKKFYRDDIRVFFAGTSVLEVSNTVKQNFELLKSVYGLSGKEFWEEYNELAKKFDILKYEDEAICNLSLGQRMRVEFVVTLIGYPKLILLDEPNIGLDENGKTVLCEVLEEKRIQGATLLVATHDMEDVVKVCSRIILLEKGTLLFYGTEKNLRSRFASVEKMELQLSNCFPDLEDLPLQAYQVNEDKLRLTYDTNCLSASEILGVILEQTQVREVNIKKSGLEDIILEIHRRQSKIQEENHEHNRSRKY